MPRELWIAFAVMSSLSIGCGDDAAPSDTGSADVPIQADAGPQCPTHLRFENVPTNSVQQFGFTGFGNTPLADQIAFSVEIADCDSSCTRCNFRGPVRNSDVNNQRCLNNTAIECESDADCDAAEAGACRFLWGPPQSLSLQPGAPPSTCYAEVFPTEEEHLMFAPNKPAGPSVAGSIDLRSGQVIFDRFAEVPQANFGATGAGDGVCPQCIGDSTPNDGLREGTCTAGATSDPGSPNVGQPCDVTAGGRSTEGSFSYDCGGSALSPSGFLISLTPSTLGFRVRVDESSPMASAAPDTRVLCGECLGTEIPTPCLRDSDCGASGPCGAKSSQCGALNPPPMLPDGSPNPEHNELFPIGSCLDGQPFAGTAPNACFPGEACNVPEGALTGSCNGGFGPNTQCFIGGLGTEYVYTPPQPEVRDGFYLIRVGALECVPSFVLGPPEATRTINAAWGFPGPIGVQYGFRVVPEYRDGGTI